jgi:alanyl-tRNA synthetase
MNETAATLKAQNAGDIAKRAALVMNELKETQKALEAAESKLAGSKIDDILKNCVSLGDVNLAVARLDGVEAGELRKMTDTAKAENDNLVVVFVSVNLIVSDVLVYKTGFEDGFSGVNIIFSDFNAFLVR